VDDDRWARVLMALASTGGPDRSRLCTLSARVVAVSGAGITLMTDEGAARMTVCSSDDVAQVMEELQFSLGEGPCVDAYAQDCPVSEPDLATATTGRWPGFAPAALAAGAVAVFGFPLRAGGRRIGTLNLYRDRPGLLSDEQVADALVVADVIAREILTIQARAPLGAVGDGLVGEPELRLVVHQATGMVAAQLEVDVNQALTRLRARAFADGVSVNTVAAAVVNRELRFAPDDWPTGADDHEHPQ
jgi:GAF domain-containing protein